MDTQLLIILLMSLQPGFETYSRFYEKNQRKCANLLREPCYSETKIIDQSWLEYFSWNMRSKKCLKTYFMKPCPLTIRRFEKHMSDYLKTKLEWTEANLLAKSGQHEMLMFDDDGPPGSYQGIPDLSRYGDIYEFAMHEVEPMKFAMKLMHKDKFLIMLDCIGGLGHIMVRANDTVQEVEVLSVAEEVGIGKGTLGCVDFLTKQ
ncbi:uncharacterized protein LOC128679474 [Plodia interpunctella]|uniref:uncharacterized protein LOC128679474 n=1 Tax=Plodia interpunctella TaxID=58824 RepID=UPI0023683CBE|nr:uncharacterized protein LOC128679474 [Plodia interpunctella]